jgi:hypothetical protein
MDFIERHAVGILIGSMILFVLLLILGVAVATPRADLDRAMVDDLQDNMVVLVPRPGVECYVIRGRSSETPRSMSCVAIPSVQQ